MPYISKKRVLCIDISLGSAYVPFLASGSCRCNFPPFPFSSCLCLHHSHWKPAAVITQNTPSPSPTPVSSSFTRNRPHWKQWQKWHCTASHHQAFVTRKCGISMGFIRKMRNTAANHLCKTCLTAEYRDTSLTHRDIMSLWEQVTWSIIVPPH